MGARLRQKLRAALFYQLHQAGEETAAAVLSVAYIILLRAQL